MRQQRWGTGVIDIQMRSCVTRAHSRANAFETPHVHQKKRNNVFFSFYWSLPRRNDPLLRQALGFKHPLAIIGPCLFACAIFRGAAGPNCALSGATAAASELPEQ